MENPDQKNFVAFVGREHLLNVAKHLTMFVNDQSSFTSYKAPPYLLDDPELRSNKEARSELVKTLALATTVYEDNLWAEKYEIPFVHSAEDIELLQSSEKILQRKLNLIEMFEDMEGLGLELKPDDFVTELKMKLHLDTH